MSNSYLLSDSILNCNKYNIYDRARDSCAIKVRFIAVITLHCSFLSLKLLLSLNGSLFSLYRLKLVSISTAWPQHRFLMQKVFDLEIGPYFQPGSNHITTSISFILCWQVSSLMAAILRTVFECAPNGCSHWIKTAFPIIQTDTWEM